MNIVDSCGWIEFFAKGPNSAFFRHIIFDEATLVVPTITVMEVTKRLKELTGDAAADLAISTMRRGCVADLTIELALAAAGVKLSTRLSIADSIILATARHFGAVLWTQDADFQGFEGVQYIPK